MPELPPLPQAIGQNAYSLLELAKIQAACLLEDHEFDLERPAIYDRMLTEGRKPMSRVRVLLEDILRPQDDLTSLSTVLVQVTDDIAKDKKELNFGFGEDVTYQSCHRGLSPFAVVNVSMATMSMRQQKAERYAKVTFQTSADVEANESFPDPIPTTFHEATELLKRYMYWLDAIVGHKCDHRVLVHAITQELLSRARAFEHLGSNRIASLLWQIFLDARRFFSSAVDRPGRLPQSHLRHILNEVRSGTVCRVERSNNLVGRRS